MKKIVFLNPPITAEERYGKLANIGNALPPLGLTNLAAICIEKGYQVKIIDAEAVKLGYDETLREIIENNPDYLGITSTTIAIFNAAKIAKMVKEKLPHIKIIIGGPHLTALPEMTMQNFTDFDIGVIGEGDITIIELLQSLSNQKKLNELKGIIYRDNDVLRKTEQRDLIRDLNSLPKPAYHLLPDLVKYYSAPSHTLKRHPGTSMITSRGCPSKCTFCANLFGTKFRGYSAQYIIDIILWLMNDFGINEIDIVDDTFVVNKKRVKQICDLLINKNINLSWSCEAKVNFVNPEMLKIMKKSGCWQIAYGIETGSQKILDNISKGTSIKQARDAIKWTKQAGIQTRGFFMIGAPGETRETIRETIDFMKEIDLDDFHVTFFTPYPGTPIYNEISKHGKYNEDWKKLNFWQPVFIPPDLTREELIDFQKIIFRKFYFRPKIIKRYLLKLLNPNLREKVLLSFFIFCKFIFSKDSHRSSAP
tara:strand:- start:497 stop:1933 length:1437 start_codon:yes stop_codon:yes gene_type:complete